MLEPRLTTEDCRGRGGQILPFDVDPELRRGVKTNRIFPPVLRVLRGEISFSDAVLQAACPTNRHVACAIVTCALACPSRPRQKGLKIGFRVPQYLEDGTPIVDRQTCVPRLSGSTATVCR